MPLVLPLRYAYVALRARHRASVNPFEAARLELRVHPSDCDVNLHVNNGRYLSLMDLGRIDHVVRSGLWRLFRANGWNPVAGGATIRFRRELRIGARYSLTTRCAGWEDRWWFFEQEFLRADGSLAARAVAKVAVLGPDGRPLPAAQVAAAAGLGAASPELPDAVRTWQRSDLG